MRELQANIERITVQQNIPNLELEYAGPGHLRDTVIRMTRRLAVVRQCFEKPTETKTQHGTKRVRVQFHAPATWWDHLKLTHPWLTRIFGAVRMEATNKLVEVETLTTHRYYDTHVIVINDRNELPTAMQTISIPYEVEL